MAAIDLLDAALPTCTVDGCDRRPYAHGWCETHYKRHQRHGSTDRATGKTWTAEQVTNLRRIYEAHPAPYPLPPADQLEAVLGHSMRSISAKAQALGLVAGKRTSTARKWPDRNCVICEEAFRPGYESQTTCSLRCGGLLTRQRDEHPRGMAGKAHSTETRARLSVTSKAAWDQATPEQREAMLEPMRKGWAPTPAANAYSRTRSGKRADLDGLFVRSAWEANYARYLNWLVAHGQVAAWEYEARTFEFPVKRGNRSYTPDFRVTTPDGQVEWHEVKGWMDASSKVKLRRFALHYPAETVVLIDEKVYRSIARQMAALIEGWER